MLINQVENKILLAINTSAPTVNAMHIYALGFHCKLVYNIMSISWQTYKQGHIHFLYCNRLEK